MSAATTNQGVEATSAPVHEPSVWLRTAIEALRRFQTAEGSPLRGCVHVSNGSSDHLVTWLYRPNLATCLDCARLVPEPDEDERCDRCGLRNVGACSPMVVRPLPRLAVCFGLCDDCRRKETGS